MSSNRAEFLNQLQRLLGVNKWQLNLKTNVMRIECGHRFDSVQTREMEVDALKSALEPQEIEQYLAHWEEAVREGHSGPTVLTLIETDGSKSAIESACGFFAVNGERFLVGVFKYLPLQQKLTHSARQLSGFLETFIEHSPSSIVVMDMAGSIISLNREFLRFIGGTDKNAYLRRSVLDPLYEINAGLGALVRRVLHSQQSERGSFEMYQGGMRQTLYWRSFPLSVDQAITPPKVFTFDMNQNGPRAA